jgi:hypothetical protein
MRIRDLPYERYVFQFLLFNRDRFCWLPRVEEAELVNGRYRSMCFYWLWFSADFVNQKAYYTEIRTRQEMIKPIPTVDPGGKI